MLKKIIGFIGLALMIRACYNLVTATPEEYQSGAAMKPLVTMPTVSPTPQRTYSTAEVNAFANTDRCWAIVDSEGWNNPKHEVTGVYKGMGYESEDLSYMYDLTKMAAVELMSPGGNDGTAKDSLAIDPLAAQIVVDVTNRVYLPQHRAIAIKKCQ